MGYDRGDAARYTCKAIKDFTMTRAVPPTMKAAVYRRYGPAETVTIKDVPSPAPAPGEVLVRIRAASVTTADWRLRAAAFPGVLWLPGRLMFGLFAPRKPVLGGDFAGTVAAVGSAVTRFAVGDRVFGHSGLGSHAEFVAVPQDGALIRTPEGMTHKEAAALPFGALAGLVFLRDVAQVHKGQRILIVGATGGVGAYATQIAAAMGADVTAVSSAEHADLARDLGAHRVIDYRTEDIAATPQPYDVIFDTVGATRFGKVRKILTPKGRFVPLNFGLREMVQAGLTKLRGGPKLHIHVNEDTAQDLAVLTQMIAREELRPVIDSTFEFTDVRAAYGRVEGRHRKGAVILTMPEASSEMQTA